MGPILEWSANVAAIVSAVATIIGLVLQVLSSQPSSPVAQIPLIRKLRPRLPYVITATIAFLLGVLVPGDIRTFQSEEWTTSLADGAEVSYVTPFTVKHPDNVQGDIWVILKPENLKYYPAPRALYTSECRVVPPASIGNEVEIPIYFGVEQDYNRRFKVLVVVADKSASQFLINTLVTWCRQNDYPGLDNLPNGIVIQREIDVRRSATR
ncbi:MAG: hypothetical protein M3328_07045 [Chloroflexota bacterium]|nr:hypothetical protein [Chloroflexota bacterium]